MLVAAFYIVALVLFILAALSVPVPRVNIGWLGLAFFTLAVLWPLLVK